MIKIIKILSILFITLLLSVLFGTSLVNTSSIKEKIIELNELNKELVSDNEKLKYDEKSYFEYSKRN